MKPASTLSGYLNLLGKLLILWPVTGCLLCAGASAPLDNWQLREPLSGSGAVAYGNDRFVVATRAFPPRLLVSTNGMDWKSYLLPEAGQSLVNLKFVNDNFLLLLSRFAYPATNGMALYSSKDGIAWKLQRFNPSGPGTPVSSVGGDHGVYVLATSDLSASTDLATWRQAVLGATGLQEFAAGRGVIIGTPWWGAGFVASTDGLTWEYISPPAGAVFSSIRFANGRFAAFAPGAGDGSAPAAVGISPYGYSWTSTIMPEEFTNCTRLVSGNDQFFLLRGDTNMFYSSKDALVWEPHSFGTNVVITDIDFGANSYVAVGNAILQSGPVTNLPPVPATLSIRNVPGLLLYGPVGQSYQIEFTERPSAPDSFVPLTNVIALTSPFLWLDTGYTNGVPRFYRALTFP